EATRVFQDDVEEPAAILRVVESPGNQGFRKSLDGGERRSEFVGDVGDKIPANAFEFAELRDVVEHDDRAGGVRGANRSNCRRKEMLPQRAGGDFRLHTWFA